MASYTPNYNLYKPAGADQFDNFLTEFGNNMDTIDQNLGGGGGSSTLAGLSDVNLTSPTTDDALIYDGAEWVNSPLSAVAFSGDYTDLSNAPTIPTKTSDLNNDSDFVSDSAYVHTDNNFTNADVTKLSGIQAGAEVNVQSDWNEADNTADDYIKNKPTIPTKTSDLNNDSGFLDSSDITVTQVQTTGTKIATIDVDGNSTDIYAPTGGGSYTEGDGIDITSNTISVDTTFTEAQARTNIASGDTFATILGKIKKWFSDIPNLFVNKTGDSMTGHLTMEGKDVILGTTGLGSNDSGDLVYLYGNGNEKMRIWAEDTYNDGVGPIYRVYKSDGTQLYWGRLATLAEVDGRVSKNGDTMTGTLTIDNGYQLAMSNGTKATRILKPPVGAGGSNDVIVYAPDKNGTLAIDSDIPKWRTIILGTPTVSGNKRTYTHSDLQSFQFIKIPFSIHSYYSYGNFLMCNYGVQFIYFTDENGYSWAFEIWVGSGQIQVKTYSNSFSPNSFYGEITGSAVEICK